MPPITCEAKKKDEAMYRLVKELAGFPGIKQVSGASLEYK
jgi:UV DNA damage repair endonuclease